MIAVVVGTPSRLCHLWYHLFEPHKLENTYISGFMVNYNAKNVLTSYYYVILFSTMALSVTLEDSMTVV